MAMRQGRFEADLVGLSTLTFGRQFQSEKMEKESASEHDARCWRERMHRTSDGFVTAQPGGVKQALEFAAGLAQDKVKGKGKATFKARVVSGIWADPSEPQIVHVKGKPVHFEKVEGTSIAVPSDGKKGGSSRVYRRFPEINPPWKIHVAFMVVDSDLIQCPEKLAEYLEMAGLQCGIGCNRPGRGGDHGRFMVENFKFEVLADGRQKAA